MNRIAIFDMDGTLIDSGHDITVSINHVRSTRYALSPLSVTEVVDAINAPVRNLADIFYGTQLYEPQARELFEAHYYDQCVRNVRLYEGVAELLISLKGADFSLGVATNAPGIFARRMLAHLGVDRHFDLILGADDVDSPKPDPQMVVRHLEHHGYVSGTDYAWMIGDNSKDMDAAKNAGIPGIFAAWGFAREGEGDHMAIAPSDVLEITLPKG